MSRNDTIKITRREGKFEYNDQPLCEIVEVDGTFSIIFFNSVLKPEHNFATHKQACLYVWSNVEEILAWCR